MFEMPVLYTMESLRFRKVAHEFRKQFLSIRLVTDDGTGLQSSEMQGEGIGMKIMEYRAGMIGAGISYTPMEKGGVAVCCSFIG